jgi:hypothetical protein
MPRGKALTLTDQATLGLFFIQRYRFLTIDQYARAAALVPFGQLEARPRISPEDQEALLRANRARYASGAEALVVASRPAPEGGLGQPELL